MSERTALGATMETMTLEEPGAEQQASPRVPGPLRCGPCAVWPRQQTWLCAVPLVMGFVGLGLSLMLLKWIVVGSVQDYVPTDLVDAKGIGQDPIFLSKPSALPKGPDISTSSITTTTLTSTTASLATVGPGLATRAADGTATVQRTRLGSPANHTASSSNGGGPAGAGGSDNRAPHLHNRVGTRVTGGGSTTKPAVPRAKEVTPHSTTIRKVGGGRNAMPSTKAAPPTPTASTTTTTTTSTSARTAPSASTPSPPTNPTQRWHHGRSSKGPSTRPTRPHHRFRTLAPTTSTLRSEFFKPCQDSQELAFCLNDGECFVIETVAGVHRHCRCKEGYHGLRCDQFVPKTDSVLSDPTEDELGIEFMESRENYQRQILSIFSIAMGISLLGVACMALYCRNKRHREKHETQLTEQQNLRASVASATGPQAKASLKAEHCLQPQKCRKVHESSISQGGSLKARTPAVAQPNHSDAVLTGKRCRSCSLSLSPTQKQKVTNYRAASRWTPPISKARQNLIGGPRDPVHTYKHLQEMEPSELVSDSLTRWQSQNDGNHQHGTCLNMQSAASAQPKGGAVPVDVPCTRLDRGAASPPSSLCLRPVPIVSPAPWQEAAEAGPGMLSGGSVSVNMCHKLTNDSEQETGRESSGSWGLAQANPSELAKGSNISSAPPEPPQSTGGQGQHRSLVTYTTTLGSCGSSRAKTIISMLGAGGVTTQSTTRVLPKASRRAVGQHGLSSVEMDKEGIVGKGAHNQLLGCEEDCLLLTELRGVACQQPLKS